MNVSSTISHMREGLGHQFMHAWHSMELEYLLFKHLDEIVIGL